MTIFGIVVFVLGWLYAISVLGLFFGIGVGWFPAVIVAMIADLAYVVLRVNVMLYRQAWADVSTGSPNRQTLRSVLRARRAALAARFTRWMPSKGDLAQRGAQIRTTWDRVTRILGIALCVSLTLGLVGMLGMIETEHRCRMAGHGDPMIEAQWRRDGKPIAGTVDDFLFGPIGILCPLV